MKSNYTVQPITKPIAERIISAKHYRRTLGIFWEGFGLFDADSNIVGVVCYGQPSAPIQKHAFEDRDFRLYEMTRLVLDADVFNGASMLIGRSLKMLSSQPCAVISYADTSMGHAGIVYQATNWIYTGAVKAHDSFYLVDGEALHPTTVRDRFGVTRPKEWAKQNGIPIVPAQPKHRYFQFVGNRRDRKRMIAKMKYPQQSGYPKMNHSRYDDGKEKCTQLAASIAPRNLDLFSTGVAQ